MCILATILWTGSVRPVSRLLAQLYEPLRSVLHSSRNGSKKLRRTSFQGNTRPFPTESGITYSQAELLTLTKYTEASTSLYQKTTSHGSASLRSSHGVKALPFAPYAPRAIGALHTTLPHGQSCLSWDIDVTSSRLMAHISSPCSQPTRTTCMGELLNLTNTSEPVPQTVESLSLQTSLTSISPDSQNSSSTSKVAGMEVQEGAGVHRQKQKGGPQAGLVERGELAARSPAVGGMITIPTTQIPVFTPMCALCRGPHTKGKCTKGTKA